MKSAADQTDTLLHTDQSQASASVPVHIETVAEIANDEPEDLIHSLEKQFDVGASGMPGDVSQGFLSNTVKSRGDIAINSFGQVVAPKCRNDPFPFAELFHERFQCRRETKVVERCGMEFV